MAPLEAALFWISAVSYALTSAVYIYSFVFARTRLLEHALKMMVASFVVHTLCIVARTAVVGNLPVAGPYETGLGGAWVVVAFTLYVSFRHSTLRAIGVGTMPLSVLLLGYGVMVGPELAPMAATLKSFWLYIHVFFAWLAFGAYAVAFGFAIIYLLKDRKDAGPFYDRFPPLKRLDDLMFRYTVFGFITDAVMIAAGAIWAKNLWGDYWGWDVVETWSLITWLIYGLAIHLRVTLGWRGRRIAWILIFAIFGMLVTYFGIDLFVSSSLHIFDAWQEI